MEFTLDNLNELDQMLRRAIRELVPEIVHEIVDPRFDAIDEELHRINLSLQDHGTRIRTLEKVDA